MAKVYVSSTYTDLKDVREQVRLTLRRLGHEDLAMEYYVAEDQRPLNKCLADVERCDLYVGIFAWRYGFIPPGQEKSITELEYRRAREKEKQCLAFLLQEQAAWPVDKIEIDAMAKIKALRQELAEEHLGGYFTSKDDVAARVAEAIHNWEKSAGQGHLSRLAAWLEDYALELDREFAKGLRQGEPLGVGNRYIEVLVRKRSTEKEVAPEASPLAQVVEQAEARILVIGGGGAGKTTMLRKLARDSARRALTDPNAPLPFYVRLNFFDAQTREFEGLLEIAARAARLTRDELYDLWHKRDRRCLFLFDGLNEVRRDLQGGCRLALKQFTQQDSHSYVITSRPGSQASEMLSEPGNWLVTEVVRLEPDQIQEFLTFHGAAGLYDRMSERLRALAQNPFLLWAIARSCAGLSGKQLPANVGELYQNLIDRHIYGIQEQSKDSVSRPTQYNYERVKKPVLAVLAGQMCRQGATQQGAEQLLAVVADQLRQIRAANEKDGVQILPFEPHTFMPAPPVATALLDEIVENGVLQRVGGKLEFMHESVRDYFAAVEMAGWSTERITQSIPPLKWRHVKPAYNELTLDWPVLPAVVMLSGLLADSSDLIRRLAGHHALLAAHCLASARSIQPEVEAELVQYWSAQLDQRHPRYRWLGCQCLRQAKVASAKAAQRLGELIRQDKEWSVRRAAARALVAMNDTGVIVGLVEEALNAAPKSKYDTDDLAIIFRDLLSQTAVLRLFEVWRDSGQSDARKHRAEQVMATMDPRFVHRVLREVLTQARSRGDEPLAANVHSALEAYDSWEDVGIISVTRLSYIRDRVSTRWDHDFSEWNERMQDWSTEQLAAALNDRAPAKRAAAAGRLGARKANVAGALLQALAREQHGVVKSVVFEALKAFDQPDELFPHWRELMLDTQWTLQFSVESRLKEELQSGPLGEKWRLEFELRQLPLPDYAYVHQTGLKWLIVPRSWSGDRYESPVYSVEQNADTLRVFDLGLRPRLAAAAVIFGSAAFPVLLALIEQEYGLLDIAVATALGEIGGTEAVPILAQLLDRTDNHEAVRRAILALGRTRSPDAVFPLIQSLRELWGQPPGSEVPNDHADSTADTDDPDGRQEVNTEQAEDWFFGSLRGNVELIVGAIEELEAREQLILVAKEALAEGSVEARFAATVGLSSLREASREVRSLVERALADKNQYVRLEAVKALAAAKSRDGESALLKVCLNDDDPKIRRTAAEGLRWFAGDEAVVQLFQALKAQDPEQQVRAAEALAFMEDESAIPALVETLETGSSRLRIAASRALNTCGYNDTETVTEALISITRHDPDRSMRAQAFAALKDTPGGTDKLYRPIQNAISGERFEEVIDLIGKEEPFVSDDANLYWWRGCARASLQRLEEALQDLDRTAALAQDFAGGHSMRAQVLDKLGRWPEALAAARAAAGIEKDNSAHLVEVGWYAYQASRLEESIEATRQALHLNPKLPAADFNLGLALLAQGQSEEAAEAYRRGIENTKEIGEEEAHQSLKSALADLKNLAEKRQGHTALDRRAQELLEHACLERFG